jgi:signal transduction histidine kinase
MKYEKLDIIPILEEFYYECTVDKKYSNRNLLLDIQEYSPCIVHIDAKNFIRVLDNLFNNALKYSKKGDNIVLRLTLKDSSVFIMVEDTGIGIKADQVTHVFQRSYMADSARTPDSKQGFGLGLSIAKSIIEQHTGSISCNSTYGKGSCFCIMLPKY